MKKFLIFCALITSVIFCNAQSVIDNFTIGPYVVDYKGQGDVKYRLRDNIDLYEYFELAKDTTIVAAVVETPVKHAVQLSGYVGTNRFAAKEIGLSGIWKQNIGTNLYFNGGLSFAIGYANYLRVRKYSMFEVGIPLQIELGKLCHEKASLYGTFGITPSYYSALMAKVWEDKKFVEASKDKNKSGFLVAPSLEFGGNIPVGNIIMRVGVYGTYKINCSTDNQDVYRYAIGRFILGAKIAVVI